MRYASIRKMDISNGIGLGIALFVQGCHFHCLNCFNQETWDFDGGKEWNDNIESKFIELASNPFIDRVSFLGGEPLCDENITAIYKLSKIIKNKIPDKKIWCYTGYTWERIFSPVTSDLFPAIRRDAVRNFDVLVDGKYIDSLRDLTLPFRGSSNQRIIDVQNSLKNNSIVLLME